MKLAQVILILSLTIWCNVSMGQLSKEQNHQLDSFSNIIKEAKHDTLVAQAYLELSEILYTVNFDTVIVLCEKSAAIAEKNLGKNITNKEKLSFQTTLAGAYNNIGYIYDDQGRVIKALNFYHKSLRIREAIDDKLGVAVSLNNIGIIYVNQGELEQALNYYLRSLKIKESLGNKKSISTSLNNIGAVYRQNEEMSKALEYYKRSLAIREELGSKRGISISLNNIGTLYNKMNSLDTALEYYQKSLIIREEIGDKRGIANSLSNIGSVVYKKGDLMLAQKYAIRSLKLSRELGFSERIKDAANLLAQIYEDEKDWSKAFEMQTLYYKMRDSIRNEETELASIRQQAQYKIETVEKEKKILAKEADIQTLKVNRNRIVALFFIVAFVLAIILVIAIYRGYKKKEIINQLLEKQKDEVSRKNEEKGAMLKEIHHRVKNNLQVVNSLLRLQSNEVKDEKIAVMFEESQHRILSMARLHEQMYKSKDLKNIDIERHFTELIKELIKDYQINSVVNLDIDIMDAKIGIKTLVPLGLIINEMISNSLKYAFKNGKEGIITVHIEHVEGIKYKMLIGDNGVGIPKDYKIEESTTLGTQLIQIFIEQLRGSINRLDQQGTMFNISFESIDENIVIS